MTTDQEHIEFIEDFCAAHIAAHGHTALTAGLRAAAERIRVLGELATRWYQPDGTFIVLPEEEVIAKRKHAALMLGVLGEECEAGRKLLTVLGTPKRPTMEEDRYGYGVTRDATDAARGALARLDEGVRP